MKYLIFLTGFLFSAILGLFFAAPVSAQTLETQIYSPTDPANIPSNSRIYFRGSLPDASDTNGCYVVRIQNSNGDYLGYSDKYDGNGDCDDGRFNTDNAYHIFFGDDGGFQFDVGPLPPGTYTLTLRRPDVGAGVGIDSSPVTLTVVAAQEGQCPQGQTLQRDREDTDGDGTLDDICVEGTIDPEFQEIACPICESGAYDASKEKCILRNGSEIEPTREPCAALHCKIGEECASPLAFENVTPCRVGLDINDVEVRVNDTDDDTTRKNKIESIVKCTELSTAIGPIQLETGSFIGNIMGVLLSIAGAIAVLLIVRSGYQLMSSQGNPEAIQEAKDRLVSAIVGLLFIIFSLVILQVIGVDILQIFPAS